MTVLETVYVAGEAGLAVSVVTITLSTLVCGPVDVGVCEEGEALKGLHMFV